MNREPIKYPSQTLAEEEAATPAAQTTASVAITDKPLGKKPLKRKPQLVGVSEIPTDTLGEAKLGEGKPRHTLPQITDWDGFVAAVKKTGGSIETKSLKPETLIPTQSNFNQEKVDRIIADWDTGKPIIVSSDNLILDGHHRWLATKQQGKSVQARVVSLDMETLEELCQDAPFVVKKKLNEQVKN